MMLSSLVKTMTLSTVQLYTLYTNSPGRFASLLLILFHYTLSSRLPLVWSQAFRAVRANCATGYLPTNLLGGFLKICLL
ncbi:hypothetical protein SODALDRAFT_38894 [Sodiomyces alkalinus F11]|uniref:Uncharacterized protein n=1 Tax=Sodiomyces alkalinus (strain CBS 110278 / VKM F-3762 / F11) TaxID=1314773 RepID=A0A3N2Q9V3_SODAK|nr:hypothetical protein SODALDRAFT_38894 [Sodiomyces alkalinus F11]ROT43425.1 hypothetical protein SODALDRAFT_38894 [Sodiomyces alkalinus F11]